MQWHHVAVGTTTRPLYSHWQYLWCYMYFLCQLFKVMISFGGLLEECLPCFCLKPKSVLCCIGYISSLKYWVSVAHKDQYLCSLIKLKHSSARFRIEIYTASVNFLRGWRPDGPDFRSKNSVTSDLRCDRLLLWEYVLHRYSLDVIMMMIMMMMIWWRRWWWWRWKWCWYLTGWFEKRLKWKSHNDTLLYLK